MAFLTLVPLCIGLLYVGFEWVRFAIHESRVARDQSEPQPPAVAPPVGRVERVGCAPSTDVRAKSRCSDGPPRTAPLHPRCRKDQ